MRATIILVLLVALSGAAMADGVGTFTPVSERRVDDLTATFQIGVINLADHERRIDLRVQDAVNVSVELARDPLLLQPSRVTTDPSGSGWLHLGEGRYAKPAFVRLTARINASTYDDNVSFRVAAVTTTVGRDRSGLRQRVVQSRQHLFTVVSSSPRLVPEEDDGELFRTIGDDGGRNTTQTEQRVSPGTGQREGSRNITRDDPVRSGDAGVNPVTVALVAAILLVTGSILREVV